MLHGGGSSLFSRGAVSLLINILMLLPQCIYKDSKSAIPPHLMAEHLLFGYGGNNDGEGP